MRLRVTSEDNEKRSEQGRSRAIHRPSLPMDLRHSTLDESSYYKPPRSPLPYATGGPNAL